MLRSALTRSFSFLAVMVLMMSRETETRAFFVPLLETFESFATGNVNGTPALAALGLPGHASHAVDALAQIESLASLFANLTESFFL